MQLNTVVLPAPFGPIRAVISPRPAVNEKSLMATMPPKRMLRCSTRSTGTALALVAIALVVLATVASLGRAPASAALPPAALIPGPPARERAPPFPCPARGGGSGGGDGGIS